MGARKRAAALSMVAQSKQLAATHKRQRVALQQQQDKDKAVAQRKLAKKTDAARSPYKPHHTVLLIGEGNFSFARSLIEAPPTAGFTPLPGCNLTASTYDSFAVAREKYADADDNIEALRAAGARVWDSVDCTALHSDVAHFPHQPTSPPSYDYIVFNFPHLGSGVTDSELNTEQHKQLLAAFLHSLVLSPHLLRSATRVHITVKRGEPYSGWKVPLLPRLLPAESRASVRFVTSVPFWPHLYPLYAHRRTIGFKGGLSAEDNEEIQRGAMTHTFMRVAEGDESVGIAASGEEVVRECVTERAADEWSDAAEDSESADEDAEFTADAERRKVLSRTADSATHKAVPTLPTSLLPVKRKFDAQATARAKPKPAAQLKSKVNLRGLLFT